MYHLSSRQVTKGHLFFMASVENSLRWGSNLKEQCQNPRAQNDLSTSTESSKSLTEEKVVMFSDLSTPPPLSHFNLPIQSETLYDKEMDCRLNALNSILLNLSSFAVLLHLGISSVRPNQSVIFPQFSAAETEKGQDRWIQAWSKFRGS